MPKKVLFIDRDGTLIAEPPVTFQVDNLGQLSFLPGVIRNLYKITKKMDYELVIVTNQDGLGTDKYPSQSFETVQNKMLEFFANEGIQFNAIHVDSSFEHENKSTRKPATGMLTGYLNDNYDLANSYVIGDRYTDVQLAKNLGAKAILISNDQELKDQDGNYTTVRSWDDIYLVLDKNYRTAVYNRVTTETNVTVQMQLDGTGLCDIETGIGFFDHMLQQIAKHAGIDLFIKAIGDLHIDEHHTVEDVGITLGLAFQEALTKKAGINRYGFCLPMDDCLAQVAIDVGGRPWLVWEADFSREKIGDMPTEMFYHFFRSFSDNARCNLNIKAEGKNEHHKIEAIFKAFARSIKMAIRQDENDLNLPTTKGIL
jgi:imidazoleglycerol-phosphate dehydratase/histidinol-phosphatase